MLGLGWTEMLVIGVVALIVIGPKDLPVVMGRIGKVIGQVQRMGREFQREINKSTGLDEVRNLRSAITSPLKQTAEEIRKEFNAIGTDGQEKPSGALKPTDPAKESVVDAIHEKAGIAPPKKSNDEMAAEYGFAPSKSEPVKAARKFPNPPSYADTPTAKAAAAKAEAEAEAAAQPKASAKPGKQAASKSVGTSAKAAKPTAAKSTAAKSTAAKTTTAKAKAVKATPAKPSAARSAKAASPKTGARPARKPAAEASVQPDAEVAQDAKPAPKPRAPRKKPADPAGKSE